MSLVTVRQYMTHALRYILIAESAVFIRLLNPIICYEHGLYISPYRLFLPDALIRTCSYLERLQRIYSIIYALLP